MKQIALDKLEDLTYFTVTIPRMIAKKNQFEKFRGYMKERKRFYDEMFIGLHSWTLRKLVTQRSGSCFQIKIFSNVLFNSVKVILLKHVTFFLKITFIKL